MDHTSGTLGHFSEAVWSLFMDNEQLFMSCGGLRLYKPALCLAFRSTFTTIEQSELKRKINSDQYRIHQVGH